MEENLQWFKIMAHYEAFYTNVGYNTTKFKPQIMSGSRPISTFLGYSIYSLFIGPIGFQRLFKQKNKTKQKQSFLQFKLGYQIFRALLLHRWPFLLLTKRHRLGFNGCVLHTNSLSLGSFQFVISITKKFKNIIFVVSVCTNCNNLCI